MAANSGRAGVQDVEQHALGALRLSGLLFDLHGCASLQFVGAPSRDLITRFQIPEDFYQRAGREPGLDIDPFRATTSHADDKRAPRGARDTAGRHQE
jgi:hypothetical protein